MLSGIRCEDLISETVGTSIWERHEMESYGRLVTGELLTDELIEKLSKEAEEGWEVEELLTWRQIYPEPERDPDARAQTAPPRRPRRRR